MMKKRKELNKNIGAKASTISSRGCLFHPPVKQQVAKPHIPAKPFKAKGETALDTMHKMCGDLGNW